MSAVLKRVWRWISPAVIGTVVLGGMAEIGHGSWDARLLIPAVFFGAAAGYTGRAVRYLRAPLGGITAWVLSISVWGLVTFLLVRIPGKCPVELHAGRCTTEESAIWGVNAGLAVLVVAMVVEQPRAMFRFIRGFRDRYRKSPKGNPSKGKAAKRKASNSKASKSKAVNGKTSKDAKPKPETRKDSAVKQKKAERQ